VIVEIDSPGGYLFQSSNIANRLRQVDWARTVAYVPQYKQAMSGAAIVALGCDDIIMHPESQIGDVGVVIQGPDSNGTVDLTKSRQAQGVSNAVT